MTSSCGDDFLCTQYTKVQFFNAQIDGSQGTFPLKIVMFRYSDLQVLGKQKHHLFFQMCMASASELVFSDCETAQSGPSLGSILVIKI